MLTKTTVLAAKTPKKAVDVERLLHWAYLEELPKRRTSSAEGIWDRLKQYGSLGGINPDPGHGSAQRYPHFGLPHPDAERIEKAVNGLQPIATDWGDLFELLAWDLAALVTVRDVQEAASQPRSRWTQGLPATASNAPDGRGISASPHRPRDVLLVNSINVEALVYSHAVKGTRPNDWRVNEMRAVPTLAERGPHAKIIGICKGKNSYSSGSYCPLRWSPSPIKIVLARASYLAWYQALCRLAGDLKLDEHAPLAPAVSPAPWIEGQPVSRIFSEPPIRSRPLPLRPQRKRPNPRPKSKISKGRSILLEKSA